jgi:sulfur carrier protein ThiS
LEIKDGTVADVISYIVNRIGRQSRKILLDQDGQLDVTIQVMVNNEGFMPRSQYSQRYLKDGDSVKFMLLVGGG